MVGVLVYESNPYKTERNACSVYFIACAVCALPGTAVYMASVPGGLWSTYQTCLCRRTRPFTRAHIGLLLKNHTLPAEMCRFKRRITEKKSEKTVCLNTAN